MSCCPQESLDPGEMADCGNSTHPDSTRPRGAFPVPVWPGPPLPRSLEPAQAVATVISKRASFWVKRWFPDEMKTLFVAFSLCVQKFGGFCVRFSFCFFLWELGGFQGSSLGWHTGCKQPHARVCAGY
ncbi:hypothetical protein mRhiFer1_009525 [Rhinolophus ferrumequinum]|uniref:Uncharacterized protein n=1 Tax=Rhinolophus ferrumequinum TaxID=59479 RepID=A0A7J7RAN0_RHIFE|nr:hypothetical protein mRhiFer1_009525 [Rhinolophus ferrumequinum]